MSKEQIPHIPNVPTTPEVVIEERRRRNAKDSSRGVEEHGPDESKEKVKLSPEQVEANVNELMELSASRAEASKHVRESYGGLTKSEREELKEKGEDAVVGQLDALNIDPETHTNDHIPYSTTFSVI